MWKIRFGSLDPKEIEELSVAQRCYPLIWSDKELEIKIDYTTSHGEFPEGFIFLSREELGEAIVKGIV